MTLLTPSMIGFDLISTSRSDNSTASHISESEPGTAALMRALHNVHSQLNAVKTFSHNFGKLKTDKRPI
ncbi:hypothetical protein K443DRAFT_10637 [Laccaria amethystina LaAM-08-1]|uniref:Uncharacterized protein n=1 Tax=Laccaria amethystina LaAM-08-1 TaxID=1095629 RepID=A0A0C9XFM0_9AGAR|nr:hypothetical protein K443DRAFT_10637 [Laccaria amethystina LaAM-08-1]